MTGFDFSVSKQDLLEIFNTTLLLLTILIIYHVLSYEIDGDVEFLNNKFLKLILYTTIGVIFYYLIVKKIFISTNDNIKQKPKKKKKTENK